jgi:hypothetical protein
MLLELLVKEIMVDRVHLVVTLLVVAVEVKVLLVITQLARLLALVVLV